MLVLMDGNGLQEVVYGKAKEISGCEKQVIGEKQMRASFILKSKEITHENRENAGSLGMVPLIINPIYTLYSGYLLGIYRFRGLLGGLNR